MLLLLVVSTFGQDTSFDYKVLKTDVVNSQNYQFPTKMIDNLVPRFTKKPVYLVDRVNDQSIEKLIGEVVCIHLDKDKWLVAKAQLTEKAPKEYVMRPIFKITDYTISSGCNFVVEKGEITKFMIISPLFASEYK